MSTYLDKVHSDILILSIKAKTTLPLCWDEKGNYKQLRGKMLLLVLDKKKKKSWLSTWETVSFFTVFLPFSYDAFKNNKKSIKLPEEEKMTNLFI